MPATQFSVEDRPLRLGFVVNEEDWGGLQYVAKNNSAFWGGARNVILPVAATSDKVSPHVLAELFGVDVLIPVGDDKEVKQFCQAYPYLRDPSHLVADLFFDDWPSKSRKACALIDIIHLVDHYWYEEFRHQREDTADSNCSIISWDEDDPESTLFHFLFGKLPADEQYADNYESAFRNGLRASDIKINKNVPLEPRLAEVLTPILLTEDRLKEYGGSSHESGIYVGNSNNVWDLVEFWNLRAAGVHLHFMPANECERHREVVRNYLQGLRGGGDEGPYTKSIMAYYQPHAEEKVEPILGEFGDTQFLRSLCTPTSWNGLNIRPTKVIYSRKKTMAIVEIKDGEPSISGILPEKDFLSKRDRRSAEFQHLAVELHSLGDYEYPGFTLAPPPIPALNEAVSRAIVLDPSEARVVDGGIALIQKATDQAIRVRPMKHADLIKQIFELAGIKAESSQAGRIAEHMIKSIRDTSALEACRIFKIRGVRRLIKQTSQGVQITWNQALRVIGRENFRRFKELYIEPRDHRHLTTQDAFRFLVKKGIFRPKLSLRRRLIGQKIKYTCMSCGLNSTLKERAFEGQWVCDACGSVQDLSPQVYDYFRDSGHWKYQLSGFYARSNNQEGALPVIISLLQVQRRLRDFELKYTTALKLQMEEVACETDLAILNTTTDSKVELGIGECKDVGGVIDQDDIDKLIRVADALRAVNIVPVLIFSKANENFEDHELERFRRAREAGYDLILLTNRELEPYDPYEDYERSELARTYPFGLKEMALNSERAYLSR